MFVQGYDLNGMIKQGFTGIAYAKAISRQCTIKTKLQIGNHRRKMQLCLFNLKLFYFNKISIHILGIHDRVQDSHSMLTLFVIPATKMCGLISSEQVPRCDTEHRCHIIDAFH